MAIEAAVNATRVSLLVQVLRCLPGVGLCLIVTLTSFALQVVEIQLLGHSYVEALVLAILLGMAVGTLWQPTERWRAGIAFSAKQLLEVAVMLLGASLDVGGRVTAAVTISLAVLLGLSIAVVRLFP